MTDQIIGSMIGAGGTVGAAVLGWLLNFTVQKRASSRYRQTLGLSNPSGHLISPLGQWRCKWYNADGTLYVEDEVTIEKWVKDGLFQGKGVQPNLSYTIQGEVDATRVVALRYRTTDFPTKAYVGVACLVFNQDGDALSGRWAGRAKNGVFEEGETQWRRKSAV